ncbi:MAG: tyrosine-protein phosphatase [Dehalococcoidia bacterium]|jgi:protein tyrosine/serine phosphatase|nr:tyrosine-protein phosphatase [Dehalococcoidia bacterium]
MPQMIETTGTFNFRDFGGYTTSTGRQIKSNLLLRCGSPDLIETDEARSLQETFSIRSIIDLRHPDELRPTRGALVPLVDNRYHLSVIDDSQSMKSNTAALDVAYGIGQSGPRYFSLLERGEAMWREVVSVILNPDSYPILAHCTAGKDRTGLTAALLLDLLGVDADTIAEDYALSSQSADRLYDYLIEGGRELEGTRQEAIERMLTPRKYMDDFLSLLYENYGDAEAYVKKLGFTEADINDIRQFLLQ